MPVPVTYPVITAGYVTNLAFVCVWNLKRFQLHHWHDGHWQSRPSDGAVSLSASVSGGPGELEEGNLNP